MILRFFFFLILFSSRILHSVGCIAARLLLSRSYCCCNSVLFTLSFILHATGDAHTQFHRLCNKRKNKRKKILRSPRCFTDGIVIFFSLLSFISAGCRGANVLTPNEVNISILFQTTGERFCVCSSQQQKTQPQRFAWRGGDCAYANHNSFWTKRTKIEMWAEWRKDDRSSEWERLHHNCVCVSEQSVRPNVLLSDVL